MVSSNYFYLIKVIYLHTVTWFHGNPIECEWFLTCTICRDGDMVQWILCWFESTSEWNHLEVPGSIPPTGKIKNISIALHLYPIMFNGISTPVTERISHFCLARNLIRPLGSTHNFTQSGWLILFSLDYLSGQHKLGKSAKDFFFAELLRSVQTSNCLLFNSSSSITPPWGKLSNLWTSCVYFS